MLRLLCLPVWARFLNVVSETKTIIRNRALNLLRNQKEEDRRHKSLVILEKLFALKEFVKANTILFYAAFDGEVETVEMINRARKLGKQVAIPTIIKERTMIVPTLIDDYEKDCEPGPYGVPVPRPECGRVLSLEDIDLAVVPGVAFDAAGRRLGRGAGYYDRFLARLPKDTPTVGLAFDFQVVDSLPRDNHDLPVSILVTNS
ncbi:MAG: 5-formyltetrahydrofolate cyclo-ligase [Candidatus Omnitrophota bacterium]|nr:5-formyltetrahydrofolate cyclo-ligase [Candidatus Omnitrophota bacterium]MDZ4242524.1 5-formyltetrahydrofolate cyclo-ligase [Candidatus Omnitrophota bacterium]